MKFIHLSRPESRRSPARGLLIYALALLLFASMDAISKYLAVRYPLPLVAWMRYAVHVVLMTAIFAPLMGTELVRVSRPVPVILRGLCLVGITVSVLLSLRTLPLAELTSIIFLAPLLLVICAGPLLKERIGVWRWLAVGGGFVGVLLVIRPGGTLDAAGVGFALLAALCMTAYQLFTRVLTRTENAVALLYYAGLVGTLLSSLVLPWFWFDTPPPVGDALLFAGLGFLGFFGHLCFTLAFSDAPASLLAPVTYLQLVWAVLLGALFFGQMPDGVALLGMALIAACGVLVALLGRQPAMNDAGSGTGNG